MEAIMRTLQKKFDSKISLVLHPAAIRPNNLSRFAVYWSAATMRHYWKTQLTRALVIAALSATANAWAFRGVVQTETGARFEGEIRLEKNGFTITDTNGLAQRLALEQVILLRAEERRQSPPLDPESDPNARPTPRESALGKRVPGIQHIGGSFIARRVHLADDTWIRFSDSPKEAALSTLGVARIFFQPP